MVAVGGWGPRGRVCRQPAPPTTRNREPRTDPHLRLAADAGRPGRREHQHHKAPGRIQRLEHNQVSPSSRFFFIFYFFIIIISVIIHKSEALNLQPRAFLGWRVGLWPAFTA